MTKVGETWRPVTAGGMARVIWRITDGGVVYLEGSSTEVLEAFARWETWDAWVARTQARGRTS